MNNSFINQTDGQKTAGWLSSFFLALILIALQILIYQNHYPDIFTQQKVFSSLQIKELLNSDFAYEALWFITVLVTLHWLIVRLSLQTGLALAHHQKYPKPRQIALLILAGNVFIIYSLNSTLHPNSIFSEHNALPTALLYLISTLGLLLVLRFQIHLTLAATALLLLPALPAITANKSMPPDIYNQPNIIIISIDSLRPDYVNIDTPSASITPNISNIVANSIWFTEAFTPVARTFPSWMSVLTGNTPEHHGAHFNLTPPHLLNIDNSIPQQLQAIGYQTVFVTDERRFANITHTFGFDSIIGPPYGVSDFILGKFGDWPLLNLITNLPSSDFWLPFNTHNRAVAVTYSPDRFIHNALDEIKTELHEKPVFMAIHLCLAHHPFFWKESGALAQTNHKEGYALALQKADQQVGQLLHGLTNTGILNPHSLLILISDHGESFYEEPDVFNDINTGTPYLLNRGGHGTDIRRLQQHHVVMAYHHAAIAPATSSQLASLTDIAPTLRTLLGLPGQPTDGIALLTRELTVEQSSPPSRQITFASEYNVDSVLQGDIDDMQAALEGASAYQITPDGKVVMRESVWRNLVLQKETAHWDGETLIYQSSPDSPLRFFHLPSRTTWTNTQPE